MYCTDTPFSLLLANITIFLPNYPYFFILESNQRHTLHVFLTGTYR